MAVPNGTAGPIGLQMDLTVIAEVTCSKIEELIWITFDNAVLSGIYKQSLLPTGVIARIMDHYRTS
jgi:hypothetical protein